MKPARTLLAFSLLGLTLAAASHAATPLNALLSVDNATANPGGVARLRVVHNSPDAPNVDVIVNGGVALSNVPFGAISDYLSVPGGAYNVKVSPAGAANTGPYVIDADVALTAGTDYTVIASGFLAEIYPAVLVDDNSAPAAGSSRVRFFHGSPDAPAVDIALIGGPVLIAGAPFGADATITVPAGTYDLEVRVAGTATEVLQLRGLALGDGVVYTAYASGLVADGSADRTLYLGEEDRFRIDATFTAGAHARWVVVVGGGHQAGCAAVAGCARNKLCASAATACRLCAMGASAARARGGSITSSTRASASATIGLRSRA